MPAAYPGAYNTYVPSHEASGKLVVDFSRNINDFALPRYTQIVQAKKARGWYLQFTIEEAGRILHDDLRQFLWPDGQAANEGWEATESFEYKDFMCKRYQYPVMLGDLTIDQADWDILAQHASIKARQAMTARTQKVISVFTDTNNYAPSHVMDVPSINGNTGSWAESTTARQDIKRSLFTAIELILDDTLAAVSENDLILVISSGLAAEISQCQEITDYIKGSPDALAQIKGELPNRNSMYNIPEVLYGVPVVVEKTRKVTSRKGASRSVSSILPKSTPFLCARPGGIEGVADAPNFSTVVGFFMEEMTVEQKRDDDNRRTKARVVENYDYVMVAPATGVLFQNAA